MNHTSMFGKIVLNIHFNPCSVRNMLTDLIVAGSLSISVFEPTERFLYHSFLFSSLMKVGLEINCSAQTLPQYPEFCHLILAASRVTCHTTHDTTTPVT